MLKFEYIEILVKFYSYTRISTMIFVLCRGKCNLTFKTRKALFFTAAYVCMANVGSQARTNEENYLVNRECKRVTGFPQLLKNLEK